MRFSNHAWQVAPVTIVALETTTHVQTSCSVQGGSTVLYMVQDM